MPLKLVEEQQEKPKLTVRDLERGDWFRVGNNKVFWQRTDLGLSETGWAVSMDGISQHPTSSHYLEITLLPKGTKLEVC